MPALDWVFVAVLAASLLLGAWRGLVYEVLSVFSWIAAFIMAQLYAPTIGAMLPMGGSGEALRYAAGFVLLFIAVVFAGGLVSWITKKLVESVGLRPVDRALGAAFGLLRGLVLLLATAVVVHMTPARSAGWWVESTGAGMATATLKQLKPALPETFGQYLPG